MPAPHFHPEDYSMTSARTTNALEHIAATSKLSSQLKQ